MDTFKEWLANVADPGHRTRVEEVLGWIAMKFPSLETRIGWSQPMFTDHGTFIIGFSVSRNHLLCTPEVAGIERFAGEIAASGYTMTKGLFRMPWDRPVDYALLERMIRFNIADKANCSTFWRK